MNMKGRGERGIDSPAHDNLQCTYTEAVLSFIYHVCNEGCGHLWTRYRQLSHKLVLCTVLHSGGIAKGVCREATMHGHVPVLAGRTLE